MAGEPMPPGGVRNCDDEVLGDDTIDNDGDAGGKADPEVAAEREGDILPFTGASIIAYVVLALQLIGAGALISRARKRQ